MKALLLHVAADTSDFTTVGVNGPIFENNRYEFIPITESTTAGDYIEKINDEFTIMDRNHENLNESSWSKESKTYSTVKAQNPAYGKTLSDFIPSYFDNVVMHLDPDFENFTYGDRVGTSRGKQINKLEHGDYIFFIASLVKYDLKKYQKRDLKILLDYQRKKMAKYISDTLELTRHYI